MKWLDFKMCGGARIKGLICAFVMEKAKSKKIEYLFVDKKSAVPSFNDTTPKSFVILLLY